MHILLKLVTCFSLLFCCGIHGDETINNENNYINNVSTESFSKNNEIVKMVTIPPKTLFEINTKQDFLDIYNIEKTPININGEDFDYICNYRFVLGNNINLTDEPIEPLPDMYDCDFIGSNHSIYNININTEALYVGFFNEFLEGEINDLYLKNLKITAYKPMLLGCLCNYVKNSLIENVHVYGANVDYPIKITGVLTTGYYGHYQFMGGLINEVEDDVTIRYCSINGYNLNTPMSISFSYPEELESDNYLHFGGLLGTITSSGTNYSSEILHCYSLLNFKFFYEHDYSKENHFIWLSPTCGIFSQETSTILDATFYDNSSYIKNIDSNGLVEYMFIGLLNGTNVFMGTGSTLTFKHNYFGVNHIYNSLYSFVININSSANTINNLDNVYYFAGDISGLSSSGNYFLTSDLDTLTSDATISAGNTTISAFTFLNETKEKSYGAGESCYDWVKVMNGSSLVYLRPFTEEQIPIELPDTYLVTFNSNRDGVENVTILFDSGALITPPKMTALKGLLYVDSWYFDKDYTNIVDLDTYIVVSAITLYAHWSSGRIVFPHPINKITYETNGGVIAPSGKQVKWNHSTIDFGELGYPTTYQTGDEVTLPDKVTKSGYIFAGWYLDSRLKKYGPINEVSYFALGDIKLYAKWIEGTLKDDEVFVNIGINGFEDKNIMGIYKKGDSITLPKDLKQEGYVFHYYANTLYNNGYTIYSITLYGGNLIGMYYPKWSYISI